jgi:serine/threonine protein kinase
MSSLDDPRSPAVGTLLDGKFRLVRFLAQGGMGAVYEASHEASQNERVAIKVLLDTSRSARESGAFARFIREAQVSSSLSSPHIVRVLGGGIDPELGCAYLAMEFLAGEDLENLVDRVGPLNPQVAVRLVIQASKALEVAHAAGITHRDIKPSNLFLETRNGEVTVKLCDFGIAKIHPAHDNQHLTGTGHVLGSPLYMAPEQFLRAKQVDQRADVWGLAMTLYHALAGRAALDSITSFTELIVAITTKSIPHLQDAAPWVSPGLANAVHGALLRDLDARCPEVRAFADALLEHAGGGHEVTAGMLVGLTSAQQAEVAPRTELPEVWGEAAARSKGPDPLLGRKLAGRYLLQHTLGEGGMGAVYQAITDDGAEVAVKVIHPDLLGSSPDAMRRLVREARMAMSIQSEHVVKMTEVDTDMTLGLPFISMELLRGGDLSALVRQAGALAPPAVCRLIIDACRGLAAAHALGVIHRDIKPANLFLHEPAGPHGELVVKVCDFGIAKQTSVVESEKTSTELTRTGGLLGSPLYMSPEQARNAKTVDARTDIWALAMSMYEALSGHKAWADFNSPGELVLAICTQDVRPLQDLAPWVPAPIAEVVHRALRRDLSERFASVDEMARALERHAASCPVLTRDALVALGPAQKSVVAERGPSARRSMPPAVAGDATRDTPPPPSSRAAPSRFLLLGAGAAALALVAATWAARAGLSSGGDAAASVNLPRPVIEQAPTASPTPSVKPVLVGHLTVNPPTARVSVNGENRPVSDGKVSIDGDAGASFKVHAETEQGSADVEVTMRSDGSLSPATVEVTPRRTPDIRVAGKGGGAGKPPGPASATAPSNPPPSVGAIKDGK